MKSSRYTPEQVAFGLRQAAEGTPVHEVCRKMGVNPTEGQLFTYTFTLPGNPRKFLNQLKKGKGPRKSRTHGIKENQAKSPKDKKNLQLLPPDPGKKTTPKQPQTKRTPEERSEYDRVRNQTQERKEHRRRYEPQHRRIAKETGKCKDCPAPAEPRKVRCEKCRDRHRQNGANGRAKLKKDREPNSPN